MNDVFDRSQRFNELTEQEMMRLADRLSTIARELPSEERKELADVKTLVVKMGTSSLTHPNGKLDLKKIDKLARVLTDLRNSGLRIVLISSGAIGCGTARLGLAARPVETEGKQAAAAVGQSLLMGIYQDSFSNFHQNIAQILLTRDVFDGDIKQEHAQKTFETLFDMGVIPIVNENDAISSDEIQEECFGDNDHLSAMTAKLVGADLLLILSDVEGVYDRNPKDPDAKLIPMVDEITEELEQVAGSAGTRMGTGGMKTKLGAARMATESGIDTVITSGEDVNNIYKILEGVSLGTFFRKNPKA